MMLLACRCKAVDMVPVLQGLLATHASWFRTQRCKDPFADLLHVDAIKVSAASPAHAGPKISCTTAGGGGPGGKASAGKIHGSHSVLAPPARRSSSRFQQGRDSPNTWLEQARRNQMEYLQHRQGVSAALDCRAKWCVHMICLANGIRDCDLAGSWDDLSRLNDVMHAFSAWQK